MPNRAAFLTVRGSKLVNQAGESVVLRGFGLGGWINMENFITGYPGNEEARREAAHQPARAPHAFGGAVSGRVRRIVQEGNRTGDRRGDASFQFKNCVQRTELAQVLASYA